MPDQTAPEPDRADLSDRADVPFRAELTRTARGMLRLGPARADAAPALRISLSLAAPLALLLAIGHLEWSLFASFGAFTSIYGRYQTTTARVRQQLFVGILLTCCVALGAVIAAMFASGGTDATGAVSPVHSLITVTAGALVAGVSAVLIQVRGLKPAGPLFPVFATTAVASAPVSAPVWLAVLITLVSASWCVLLSRLAQWTGEGPVDGASPGAVPPVPRAERRVEFSQYALVALAGGSIATLTGIASPYWAQVAAVVPLSAPGRRAQVERGLHRIVGTAIGVLVTAFLLSFPSQPWQTLIWVVLLQFLAELFVLRNYALALTVITPLALLMVQLANPHPAVPLLLARVAETGIGATVGILGVLVSVALARRARRR